jgi:hypothetical protein
MTDRERYLKLATWSLWGQQKKIVRMELEAHIEHKVWKYQMRGYNHTEALEKTLADLGQPHIISAGMTGVYTMPNLIRRIGLIVLLSSLGLTAFNAGAQVSGTTRLPIIQCLSSLGKEVTVFGFKVQCETGLLWINKPSLKTTLEALDVQVTTNKDWSKFQLLFPNSSTPIEFRFNDRSEVFSVAPNKGILIDPEYMSAQMLFTNLQFTGLPMTLTDWELPTISVGNIKFQLSSQKTPINSKTLYFSALYSPIQDIMPINAINKNKPWLMPNLTPAGLETTLSTKKIKLSRDQPNQVYVLITREAGTNKDALRLHQIQVSNANQEIEFQTGLQAPRFVESIKKFYDEKSDSTNRAVLLQFTGRLDQYKEVFEIVPPSEIQVLQ